MACSYRATDGCSSESKTFLKKGRTINELHFSNIKEEECYLGWCSRRKAGNAIVTIVVSAAVLKEQEKALKGQFRQELI